MVQWSRSDAWLSLTAVSRRKRNLLQLTTYVHAGLHSRRSPTAHQLQTCLPQACCSCSRHRCAPLEICNLTGERRSAVYHMHHPQEITAMLCAGELLRRTALHDNCAHWTAVCRRMRVLLRMRSPLHLLASSLNSAVVVSSMLGRRHVREASTASRRTTTTVSAPRTRPALTWHSSGSSAAVCTTAARQSARALLHCLQTVQLHM